MQPKPRTVNSSHSSTMLKPNQHSKSQLSSSKKVYVPISPLQTQNIPSSERNRQNDDLVSELRKANHQLKQKQQIYIDKLMKLQEGLEKQHLEFMQLQDLYNGLFSSYKQKQEEISQLELLFRETNRKKQTQNEPSHFSNNDTDYKLIILEKEQTINRMEELISQQKMRIKELTERIEKLTLENQYHKNKQKMMDSRATLHSKVFEELEEWQRVADYEKEEKIKMQYQIQFLKNRNGDLEGRVNELEQIVKQKQQQLGKLRQSNILLHRQNSESKILSRSMSKSPRKNHLHLPEEQQNSNRKITSPRGSFLNHSNTKIIDQLHQENKNLRVELQKMKQIVAQSNVVEAILQNSPKNVISSLKPKQFSVKEEEFFSFSREEHPHHHLASSRTTNNHSSDHPNFSPLQKHENIVIMETSRRSSSNADSIDEKSSSSPPRFASGKKQKQPNDPPHSHDINDQLQDLPPALEIETLINSRKSNKNRQSEGQIEKK